MNNLSISKTGYVLGVVSVVFFLICTIWGGLFSSIALKELHFSLMQLAYPGFSFTAIGFVIGLIEAFVYGFFFGALFAWLHKKVCCNNIK